MRLLFGFLLVVAFLLFYAAWIVFVSYFGKHKKCREMQEFLEVQGTIVISFFRSFVLALLGVHGSEPWGGGGKGPES